LLNLKNGNPQPNNKAYDDSAVNVDDASKEYDVEAIFQKYARSIDCGPRKINRILNAFHLCEYVSINHEVMKSISIEKLFLYVALQELSPYRTSWLLYISQCVQEKVGEKDESLSFWSLLEDLREEQKRDSIEELNLATVYTRIVCSILHCLPSSEKYLTADSGLKHYAELLTNLTLRDLYSLNSYAFNLPESMMNEIKVYRDYCVISKRIVERIVGAGEEKQDNSYWVASYVSTKPPGYSFPVVSHEE